MNILIKSFGYIFLSTLIAILFVNCSKRESKNSHSYQDIYIPEYSSNFKIEDSENSDETRISVYNPWQGAKEVVSTLVISPDEHLKSTPQEQILKTNAQRIVCMSSTHIAMLDTLGAVDRIVGVSGKEYITNKYIHQHTDQIPDIGYEGNINYEALIATNPDLVLLFSVNGASSMEAKLNELNIPYLYIGDYVEENPLGKSEWIVPLAHVIGKREEGVRIFEGIKDKYQNLKHKVSENNLERPKVMVNAPFLDSWFMPSTQSFIAQMIEDAGGEYIYKRNTGSTSLPLEMEDALKLVSEADFWINTGDFKTYKDLVNSLPGFSNAECVKDSNIYNNNNLRGPFGGNDCYESGVINPDIILRDMIKIFHPDLVDEDFYYYHKLK